MQGLHILLCNALLWYEAHAGLNDGDRNSFCIVAVVLLAPAERFDVLRGDDPHFVAERFELALPIKRAGAGLDANHTGRVLCDGPKKSLPPHTPA